MTNVHSKHLKENYDHI